MSNPNPGIRYQSHKKVWALKIAQLIWPEDEEPNEAPVVLIPADEGFSPVDCEKAMFSRYKPAPGDYLVVYEDGYRSFSPAKAFEEGYTKIESAS